MNKAVVTIIDEQGKIVGQLEFTDGWVLDQTQSATKDGIKLHTGFNATSVADVTIQVVDEALKDTPLETNQSTVYTPNKTPAMPHQQLEWLHLPHLLR